MLWDCDNSLLKTERPALYICHSVLKEAVEAWTNDKYTFEVNAEEFVSSHTGLAFCDMLAEYLNRIGKSDCESQLESFDAFVDKWSKIERERIIEAFERDGIEPTPGTVTALQSHNRLGLRPVIVSSSADERLVASLKAARVNEYFESEDIYSAQNFDFMRAGGQRKPSPDIYLHAMLNCNISPKECIAIEDSKSGVLSALRAGIDVLYYVGAEPPSPSRQNIETFLSLVEHDLNLQPYHSNHIGRILAVTDDNGILPNLVCSLRAGEPYQPFQVIHMGHKKHESITDDFDSLSFGV